MRNVTYYHKDTGALHRLSTLASDDLAIALNTPADHVPIDHPPSGSYLDWQSQRVNLELVRAEHEAHVQAHAESAAPPEYRPSIAVVEDWQPPPPSPEHEWNSAAKRWQLGAKAREAAEVARAGTARRAEIIAEQQPLLRRLALNPDDAAARSALADLHAEASRLES